MVDKEKYTVLKIRKSAWVLWVLRVIWFIWLLFWAEVTVGSWKEAEQRAFIISLIVFLVSLILGILLWLWGYLKFKKVSRKKLKR